MFYHGVALTNLRRHDEALVIFDALVSQSPQNITYAQNRAALLSKLSRFEEAETAVDDILRQQPALPEALLVKSVTALNRASYDEARATLDKIIGANPAHLEAIHIRGEINLLTGRMEDGWRDNEARWTQIGPKPRVENVAEWNGEELKGRSLLVFHEQGLGDTLQFCRFAKLLSERGADVTIVAPPRMRSILSTLTADVRIVGEAPKSQDFDFQIPLMSLPMRTQATLDDLPSWPSYLAADPERVRQWKDRLGSADGLTVAISWRGNTKGFEQAREMPLRAFQPLSRHPSVRLISLQANDGVEELKNLPPGMHVETFDDLDSGPDAFVDTAAVMANVDLVVTCDTAIAHLAGALGRPTWVALKKLANWRWFLDRSDSPWYPSMKLYRQQRAGDWDEVFERMAADLEGFPT
jgi:tetratricopeptide (TPR) repeat protein